MEQNVTVVILGQFNFHFCTSFEMLFLNASTHYKRANIKKKILSVSLKQGAKRQMYLKSNHLADFDVIFY